MRSSILNVALRGAALLGRFVLLLALAQYLSPAEVGLFALFSAANLWGVYLQGVEFHLFNVREIVAADEAMWARRTRDAFVLYAILYVLATGAWTGLFGGGLLPWSVFIWFLATLAFEHVTQEAYRLFNAFGRPLAGSLVVFVRSGLWMYAVAVVIVLRPGSRSLETVFIGWTCGGALAVVLALVFVRRLPWRGLPPIDWPWLRRGLAVGLPLLAGSLALRGISLFERWLVGYTHGDVALGVFGFYATIAGALPVLADSGVGAVLYPKMMKAWQQGDREAYRQRLRSLFIAFAVFLGVSVPAALVAVYFAVGHIGNGVYASHFTVYGVLLASAALWCASAVPQYALWAQNRDRAMIAISVIGLVTAVAADLVLVPRYGAIGAAWGQFVAMTVMLVVRLGVMVRA